MIIFVLIILCVCHFDLVFASIFVDDHSAVAVEDCVSNFCEHFFGKNDTVYVVVEDDYTNFKINITNPVVMVNVNKQFQSLTNGYRGHYIIYTNDALSLNRTMSQLTTFYGSKPWLMPDLIERNSLIVTKSTNISKIFKVLWKRHFFNAAVLEYDDVLNTQNVTVYQSHPYLDHENECGAYVKVLNPQNCNTITTSRKHSKTITNYPKCFQVTISYGGMGNGLGCDYLWAIYDSYFRFINEDLNVKLKIIDKTTTMNDIILKAGFFVPWVQKEIEVSEVFGYQRYVFLVPTPPRMSPLKTIFIIFHTEVWIMVLFGLILVWLSWSLLAKYLKLNYTFEKFIKILIHVLSIALWGSTASLPRHRALRCLVVCFMFYSVVIQTAFTSKLLHFMVVPQYESGINSLEDLAESQLNIFGERVEFNLFFYQDTGSDDDFVSKLQLKFINLSHYYKKTYFKRLSDIATYKNCSLFLSLQAIRFMKLNINSDFQEGIHYKIIDNAHYTKKMEFVLHTDSDYFFLKSTDVIIRRIKESGIGDKIQNEINEQHFPRNHFVDDTKVPLSMQHLIFGFTILCIGQLIAFLVFLGEILYCKRRKNSKITPTSGCTRIHREEPATTQPVTTTPSTAT